MAKLSYQEIDKFVSELGAQYEAYARNKIWDQQAGKELAIPVGENAKVREELQRAINDLCVLYLTLSDEQRDHVRKLVQPHRSLLNGLLGHIGWAGSRIKSSNDGDWLKRGLAAASIEDNRTDYRDTFVALGGLYLSAARAGLDVSENFREAAEMSSATANPLIRRSMRDFLSTFEASAYFKQEIQPKVDAKGGSAELS